MEETAWGATDADIERIVELAARFRSDLAGERGGELWQAADVEPVDAGRVLAWLADPAVFVVVGGIDGAALGFAVARAVGLRDGTRLGVIDELFVEREAREVGVGEAIVDAVSRWCRAEGCRGIDATALPGMRASKNFFEGSGFVTRRLTMHHRLTDE
ncbi:MAG TPA: GNAT family N-acetyltransferase [Acidimicrobiia bacterium]|jgi:GNAT superfamily N-acetyltransferase